MIDIMSLLRPKKISTSVLSFEPEFPSELSFASGFSQPIAKNSISIVMVFKRVFILF